MNRSYNQSLKVGRGRSRNIGERGQVIQRTSLFGILPHRMSITLASDPGVGGIMVNGVVRDGQEDKKWIPTDMIGRMSHFRHTLSMPWTTVVEHMMHVMRGGTWRGVTGPGPDDPNLTVTTTFVNAPREVQTQTARRRWVSDVSFVSRR